jgi:hypothetical protein
VRYALGHGLSLSDVAPLSAEPYKLNAEKISVAAAWACAAAMPVRATLKTSALPRHRAAARDCRRQNGEAGPQGEPRSGESSITEVIDSARASANLVRACDR